MYHIFICDDEKRFTEVLEKRVETCLKEQGQSYEIQIFYNGIEMFQAMQKKAPEILLLDIDMPEISGMELAEQIFSSNMNTNVIFVTNRDDLVFQAIHYQPFRFIRKEKLENRCRFYFSFSCFFWFLWDFWDLVPERCCWRTGQ
mgnify:CR=1 FL=1